MLPLYMVTKYIYIYFVKISITIKISSIKKKKSLRVYNLYLISKWRYEKARY